MNENEIGRIAAAMNCLRPDWPTGSIRALLAGPKMKHRPRRDVIVALGWVAAETESKTPGRVIEETGPWWKAAAVEGGEDRRYHPPKDHQACGKHPGEWRDRCRACTADRLVAEPDEPVERTPRTDAIAAAKAAALEARTAAHPTPDDHPPAATDERGDDA